MTALDLVGLIAKKRDGKEHTEAEISRFIRAFVDDELADYQMAAWLMAGYQRGFSEAETTALLFAMRDSGELLKFSRTEQPVVDKHSTGGVGDKISLCLMPLAAACGVRVPSIAGRGLGHTGGTLDKLSAIPGFRWDLEMAEFVRIVETVGCAIGGQTGTLAPADRRMYALRDVTATVDSVPLIVASILSKKLAEGLDGLVLDVKVGAGAFMQELSRAEELARALVRVGKRAGAQISALITDMDVPLGTAIGNSLEVREAVDVLKGEGPQDTVDLTLDLGAEMLVVGGVASTTDAARRDLQQAIRSGAGLEKFKQMVTAQGGDAAVIDDTRLLPTAQSRFAVRAERGGVIQRCHALELATVAMKLGAGRARAEDTINLAAGMEVARKPGESVSEGEVLAWLHTDSESEPAALVAQAKAAFLIGEERPSQVPLVLGHVRPDGEEASVDVPHSSRVTFDRRSKLPPPA